MTRGGGAWGRLRHTVLETITRRALWSPGEAVAVAVSGGRDSMVLLDLLVVTQPAHRAVLSVVTIDHGTRPDSAEDADFVAARAAELGLACARRTLALGRSASEATCRDARYAVFAGLDVDRVALGHHQRDQAETLLLAALRGGGTRALAGMPWSDGRHVRPLLDVDDAAIDAWAAGRGLGWREDPTNADLRFLRNHLRQVMPALLALRPGAQAALARAAGHLADDEALLEAQSQAADPGGDLRADWVLTTPAPLVRRALLRRWPAITAGQLDALLAACRAGTGGVQLSKNIALVVARGVVSTVEASAERP
jgi:tRNA(Ile)-lysidine synthase